MGPPIPFAASGPTVVYDHATRALRGQYWPDGMIGFVKQSGFGQPYLTWAADGGTGTVRGTGTIPNPANVYTAAAVIDLPVGVYNYAGGGPVLTNPADGSLLLWTHHERWPPTGAGGAPNAAAFYASIGLCRSTNNGSTWGYLGEVVRPHFQYDAAATVAVETAGGSVVRLGKWLYCYFREYPTQGSGTSYLAVARADAAAVFAAAAAGGVGTNLWTKYAAGAWTQSGLTGTGDELPGLVGQNIGWTDVAVHAPTGVVFLAACLPANDRISVSMSPDGVHWSTPVTVADRTAEGTAEVIYPSLAFKVAAPVGADRAGGGDQFGDLTVLYLSGNAGFNRWTGTALKSRLLTFKLGGRANRARGGPAGAARR